MNSDDHKKGNALYKERNFDEALLCYRKALDAAPHSSQLMNNMSAVLIEKGDLDQAKKYCEEALKNANEDYRPKILSRQSRIADIENLMRCADIGKAGVQLSVTPPCYFRSFEYFPLGHDEPQDLIHFSCGEYSKGDDNDAASTSMFTEVSDKRALLAASSDPRHVLQTISFFSIRRSRIFQGGDQSSHSSIELLVNDIVPEVLARSMMLIILLHAIGMKVLQKGGEEREKDIDLGLGSLHPSLWFDTDGVEKDDDFMFALWYHIFCSVNLAPPFHEAYKQLLKLSIATLKDKENVKFMERFEFEDGLLDTMIDIWNYWLDLADSRSVDSVSFEDKSGGLGKEYLKELEEKMMDQMKEIYNNTKAPEDDDSEDEMKREQIRMIVKMRPDFIEKAKLKGQTEDDLVEELLSHMKTDMKKTIFDIKPVAEATAEVFPADVLYEENNNGMMRPSCGFDSFPLESHKVNSSLLSDMNPRARRHIFPPHQQCRQPVMPLFARREMGKSLDKKGKQGKLEPFEVLAEHYLQKWVQALCFSSIDATLKWKVVFSCKNLLDWNSDKICDSIFLSNVPDYVNAMNCIVHAPFRDQLADGGFLCFDAVCTLPLWFIPANHDDDKIFDIYMWTHGRLTEDRLRVFGWKKKQSWGTNFMLEACERVAMSQKEWMLFLEQLFLMIAFPVTRGRVDVDLVPAVNFASLRAVIKSASKCVPVHWAEPLIESVLKGKLGSVARPPLKAVELPVESSGLSSKKHVYNVAPFAMEFRYLFGSNGEKLCSYVSPSTLFFNSQGHRRDVRVILGHKDDEKIMGKLFDTSGMSILMSRYMGDQPTRSLMHESISKCSRPLYVLTSYIDVIGEDDRYLTIHMAKQDFELLKEDYICFLVAPSYSMGVTSWSLKKFKEQEEKEDEAN